MNAPVVFRNTTFDVVDHQGTIWLRLPQIGVALGYTDGYKIQKVYGRHADEFTPEMTAVIRLPTEGGEQDVRIFSPRGCYALGMFARTRIAKDFRQWVLDVLEGKSAPAGSGPACLDTLTPSEQQTLKEIVHRKVGSLPADLQGKALAEIWSRLQNHFRVAKYAQLPRTQLADAIVYVTGLGLRYNQADDGCERLNSADLGAIASIVAHISHNMPGEKAWIQGVWSRLREVTQTPAPDRFKVHQIPEIAEELKRIWAIAETFQRVQAGASKALIKRVLRGGAAEGPLLEEMSNQFAQAAMMSEADMLEGLDRWHHRNIASFAERNGNIGGGHLRHYSDGGF